MIYKRLNSLLLPPFISTEYISNYLRIVVKVTSFNSFARPLIASTIAKPVRRVPVANRGLLDHPLDLYHVIGFSLFSELLLVALLRYVRGGVFANLGFL